MKIDYNKIMHKMISSFDFKPKLLLHCCCAPCSSAVIEKLKEYFDITYLYFNPNIFPKEEYARRRDQFIKLISESSQRFRKRKRGWKKM